MPLRERRRVDDAPPATSPGGGTNTRITATILTRNSARRLAALTWCDEVVVLDTGSTDETLEIAGRFPNVAAHRLSTWTELAEMAASQSIVIASHGFTHSRLDSPDVDLHTEIVVSQTTLAARTGRTVGSFVLPYGRFNATTIAAFDANNSTPCRGHGHAIED